MGQDEAAGYLEGFQVTWTSFGIDAKHKAAGEMGRPVQGFCRDSNMDLKIAWCIWEVGSLLSLEDSEVGWSQSETHSLATLNHNHCDLQRVLQ